MKKLIFILTLGLILINTGCASKTVEKEQETVSAPVENTFEKKSSLSNLAQNFNFKVGACIANDTIGNTKYTDMITADFNTITACNEFKAYSLLNQAQSQAQNKPVMNYKMADRIANFAQLNNIGVRGHVLVWDAYMCDWFFREGFTRDGNFVTKQEAEQRLSYYISEVISHFENNFPGVVYCWDVVNEAVADGINEAIPGNPYGIRKTRSGTSNIFNDIIGEDYVLFAFKCAKETITSLNADIKLFYNDYNTFYPGKRDNIIKLIKHLNESEKLCDGIGMQGYIGGYGQQSGCMNPNDLNLIKQAIILYSNLGIEVQMTEVAVRNYDNSEMSVLSHAKFYGNLFKVLKDTKIQGANFTAITIWGLCDNPFMDKNDYSYKMNGPFCGLFSKYFVPKTAYEEVYKVLSE